MGNGRDDFTLSTIRKAAGRVGYRCSFPGCKNATVGASMENSSKTSVTGVAAHICAAAKGGPRYDEHMTPEERSGIENCIWLCQTHSKLIDTDVNTYTVELLRKWKVEAEKAASLALSDGNFFAGYYEKNKNDLSILEQLFNDMIISGQYDKLEILLGQYKSTLSEQYEELIYRFWIIYDVYCRRSNLQKDLKTYCNLPCKSGIDNIAGLFLSFHLIDELQSIIRFCTEGSDIKNYSNLAINGLLDRQLFVSVADGTTELTSEEIEIIISKYITIHLYRENKFGLLDTSGNKFQLYSDEFFFKAISYAYELKYNGIYKDINTISAISNVEFTFIRDNIETIKLLDISLQEYIWEQFLMVLSEDYELFNKYYHICPENLKQCNSIQSTLYICQINHDPSSINLEEDRKSVV